MKKVLNVVVWLLILPFYVIISPYLWYRHLRGFDMRLFGFLTYGRPLIGDYCGRIKVCTHSNNSIYESDSFCILGKIGKWHDFDNKNITQLLKMKVYNYWVEDDYLIVKVYTNDKLINKLMKDYLKNEKENK